MTIKTVRDVLEFWFSDRMQPYWFAKSEEIDHRITEEFGPTYEAALRRELDPWMETAEGALALVITLDQFPRNMFRGSGRSFESNDLALEHARAALNAGFDQQIEATQRQFFYLPFMHSEDLPDQTLSVELYEALGNENSLAFAIAHRDIIERFGRFPHRNAVLDRPSTPDEVEFLKTHSGF